MSLHDDLAARLRQAIQGCSIHNHGPIQAWVAIEEACNAGEVKAGDIARLAMQACTQRIAALQEAGVDVSDQRIKKEELTRAFIERLLT
jgi:hypothetical protein